MKRLIILVALAAAAGAALAGMALNPDITLANLHDTICKVGWSKTVRPPVSFTNKIKYSLMDAAKLPRDRAHDFELDHHVPLILGGSPTSPDNLWLQAWDEATPGWSGQSAARVKDKLEVRLNRLVCSGALPLAEAQACIYEDWRACAEKHHSTTVAPEPEEGD